MSELKVNKITPRTGTTVQLGESGDTITIPAGATLTNSGTATGFGLSFCTTAKTSPFTATAGKGFLINTGSAVTVTLPASPSTGDELIIVDQTGQAATNNITLARNSSKIKGLCQDAKLKINRGGLRLVYSGAPQGWITATAGNDATGVQSLYVTATGGTITTSGNYKIHTFNSDSTFAVSSAGNSDGSNTVDYITVAGGGGGGKNGGGGGGAGGARMSAGTSTGSYTSSPLGACVSALPVTAQSYPITIGGGGAGSNCNSSKGVNGGVSTFSTITSAGGGGGGSTGSVPGSPGGSGGGVRSNSTGTIGAGNTPPVSPAQGNSGGAPSSGDYRGTGGGGASTVGGSGADGSFPGGGIGGTGITNGITGSSIAFAGGASGGANGCATPYPTGSTCGTGGAGGQNAPGPTTAGTGTTNRGGGGGGGSGNPPFNGGNGGSGVVIIRYKYQN